MTRLFASLKRDLGVLGLISLLALGGVVAFSLFVVKPLEIRKARLERQLGRNVMPVSVRDASGQMDDFYRYFDRKERTDVWLAKLYGIGTAAGLQLRAGTYRMEETRQRFERYRIELPVRGSYAQVRAFLEASLAEIPVMSVDQLTFRRKTAEDGAVDAQIVLTLHFLRK